MGDCVEGYSGHYFIAYFEEGDSVFCRCKRCGRDISVGPATEVAP